MVLAGGGDFGNVVLNGIKIQSIDPKHKITNEVL
jgi:hypothetical protein